jgi:GH18 family chitinase
MSATSTSSPRAPAYGTYLLEGELFVGFDDAAAIAEKVRYVLDQELGGVMFWDFPGDLSPAQVAAGTPGAAAAWPDRSLVHRIAEELEAAQQTP